MGNKEESCLKSGNLVNLGGDAKLLSTTVYIVKSELGGEVSKIFIIVRFGLGPSNQLNSTTGLTLWHVATMVFTAEKPHSN